MSRLSETYGLRLPCTVENAGKLLVRMGRLELPRPLQALEPKSSICLSTARYTVLSY